MCKDLGLHWYPVTDTFTYHSDNVQSAFTKRAVLSSIAKIYDPLGAVVPITFWEKCFMQRLWKEGYEFDSPLSSELASAWALFASKLPVVSSIWIARHIPFQSSSHAQLIGFSDVSLKGYAAVVHLRLEYVNAPSTIHLITNFTALRRALGSRYEVLQIPFETYDWNPNFDVWRDGHASQPDRSHLKLESNHSTIVQPTRSEPFDTRSFLGGWAPRYNRWTRFDHYSDEPFAPVATVYFVPPIVLDQMGIRIPG